MMCCNGDCPLRATIHLVRGKAPDTGDLIAASEYEGQSFCSVECLVAWSAAASVPGVK